jgi:hypothetical protein
MSAFVSGTIGQGSPAPLDGCMPFDDDAETAGEFSVDPAASGSRKKRPPMEAASRSPLPKAEDEGPLMMHPTLMVVTTTMGYGSPMPLTIIAVTAAMITATAVMQVVGLFRRFGMPHTVGLALMLWLMLIYLDRAPLP